MAEGLLRDLSKGSMEAFSAGTHPRRLHPYAVEAMREIGLDISGQRSKGISELPEDLDVVITVCDSAAAECPTFSGTARRDHWSIPDPAVENQMAAFRAARDELRARIQQFLLGKQEIRNPQSAIE